MINFRGFFRFDMPPRIFRVTATLPGSVAKVAAILRDINNTSEWNKALQVSISKIWPYFGIPKIRRKFGMINTRHWLISFNILAFKNCQAHRPRHHHSIPDHILEWSAHVSKGLCHGSQVWYSSRCFEFENNTLIRFFKGDILGNLTMIPLFKMWVMWFYRDHWWVLCCWRMQFGYPELWCHRWWKSTACKSVPFSWWV